MQSVGVRVEMSLGAGRSLECEIVSEPLSDRLKDLCVMYHNVQDEYGFLDRSLFHVIMGRSEG